MRNTELDGSKGPHLGRRTEEGGKESPGEAFQKT